MEQVIKDHGFDKEPHLIYNVDEKGFPKNHSAPPVVCGNQITPQAVTAGKACTTTLIGCYLPQEQQYLLFSFLRARE